MNRITRIGYAILSGGIFGIAWAQWSSALLLMIAFVPLLLVEDYLDKHKNNYKSVQFFLYSLITFVIWNTISTWWIYNAAAIGMIAAIVLNSLLMSTVMWGFHISKRHLGKKFGYFTLIFYWIAFEYFTLNWELSWSWLNLGNGFAKNIQLVQWYEYTGIFGGTLWVLVGNIIISLLVLKLIKSHQIKAITNSLFLIAIWLLIPISISLIRYYNYNETGDQQNIVVLQPNIDPYNEKFNGMSEQQQIQKLLGLAKTVANDSIDYFVAPETALPRTTWERYFKRNRSINMIKDFLSDYPNAKFVIGASTRKLFMTGEEVSSTARSFRDTSMYYDNYNTALQIDTSDNILTYHKAKLVVGVEKMPFPKTLSFLEDFALDMGGTFGSLGTQDERITFNSFDEKIRVAPIICFESIFGEYVNEYVKKGSNLLFVITNDAWWGDTPGYKQHLRFSQLRAVETRRSIARSANTGISCFINQKGDIIKSTNYWVEGAIRSKIKLNNKFTFYVIYGNFIARILSFLAAISFFLTLARVLQPKQE